MNVWPCMRGTGSRVTYIADDWKEMRVRLPLSWRTRNYVGTIFGGSLYAAVDPHYMLMLIHCLGREYEVWDKAATIRFRRPGRSTLFATFQLTSTDLDGITTELETAAKLERTFTVDLVDEHGTVHATVQKVIHIRRRAPDAQAMPPSAIAAPAANGASRSILGQPSMPAATVDGVVQTDVAARDADGLQRRRAADR